jgi:predicted Fe-Mo cluster-binding NifX family protein
MKVAVTSTLPSFDALVGTELHSSKYLLIIDPELIFNHDTIEYKVMMNPVMMVSGPAKWKLFTQELFQEDVQVLLSGDCNSEAAEYLGHLGIQVIEGMSGSVRNVVNQFKEMCMADTIIMPVENTQE